MNEKIILGLDISTKCIGVCVLYYSPINGNKILKITHFKPKVSTKINNIESLFIKTKIFEDEFIKEINNEYNITDVIIEEPLLRSNNVNTVDTLIRFNGMISNSIYRIMGIVPQYISSYEARKYAFPELLSIRRFNKNGTKCDYEKTLNIINKKEIVLFGDYSFDCDKKLILWNKISELFPYINWLYKNNGDLKKENFDASDALVTCIAFANKDKFGELQYGRNIIIKNIKKSTNKKEITYELFVWGAKYDKKIMF